MRLTAIALVCAAPMVAGTIEGRVTNGVTGEPVAGASVRFVDRHSHPSQASTDSSGFYRLTGLADGDYTGEVSKEGFSDFRQSSDWTGLLNGTRSVHVSGDVAARFDAQLQPWGGLRGRVVDEEGQPAAKVAVEISRGVDNIATTDESGAFRFEELPPGSYTVVAKPAARTQLRDGARVGAVPVYYPAATQLADALPIRVEWGGDVAGIEIRLKSMPVHRIAGVVVDQAGKPVPHATVRLLGRAPAGRQGLAGMITGPGPRLFFSLTAGLRGSLGPGPEPELAHVESKEDGAFEFAAVEQGDWRVSADIGLDEKPRSGVASGVVGDKDTEGVQIRISTQFSVEVTAEWGNLPAPAPKDGGPVPTGYLTHLFAEEQQPQLDFDATAPVTSVNGAFPGRYRVAGLRSPDGVYAAAVMFGGKDVLGQTVELAPGAGPLHVIVRHDGGSLRGTVEGGAGATAFLVSRSAGEVIDYLSVSCGSGGAFEFKDVVPGDYYAVAFRHSGPVPPQGLPDSIVPLATPVAINPGSAASANLRANQWLW